MTEPRRLKGHKAIATYCIASRDRPGLVATAGEDGCVCFFDLRCKDVLLVMDVGNNNPISSLCFKTGNENIIYVSAGNEVRCYDVNLAASWKPLESYSYNKDEINQIACNPKSSFLAAADDCGDVKIVDIRNHCLYKTLRAGHSTICSSVQFLPWRPWEVITGGLDSKLFMWDFSKGRPQKVADFGMPDMTNTGDSGQCLNPAFVHSLAVPDIDVVDKVGKICAVARGDGAVNVLNIELELAAIKSKTSSKTKKVTKSVSDSSISPGPLHVGSRKKLHLEHSMGGHSAAVSCVTFSLFGEKGKFIISGGNDKSVKVWDWYDSYDAGAISGGTNILSKNFGLSKKVNWLCTTPMDSENLVVCDTSRVVKVFSVT
ncbi:OLC1v1021258C1 [Oldenlandia corymbosa var. corymbosa]|uniref:OLC1v1021258C1 n=1 Tax=Oldenlandia corymbosa var. corymbosa TaxID=529605 RepID=A0AAV1BXP3_OLDCO|nr:OLC1v1021258C1 [Oldenlandia corymbosa var. corymbosa]